jgi:hypothetical protein
VAPEGGGGNEHPKRCEAPSRCRHSLKCTRRD